MIPETDLVLQAFARHPLDVAPEPHDASDQTSTSDLIAHILERYHETHKREFAEAISLARKVESTHVAHPSRPVGLADHLAMMTDDLLGHQRKEEAILFPLMLQGGAPGLTFPIARMMAEHRDVDDQLEMLRSLTDSYRAPQEACRTWRTLYDICGKIDRDLQAHMRLENEVLFVRFL